MKVKLHCDTCCMPINDVEDGWVEWIRSTVGGERRTSNMRIVHHRNSCQYNEQWVSTHFQDGIVGDFPLADGYGPAGLDMLEELYAVCVDEHNALELMRLICRLQIPGFERKFAHLFSPDEE